MTTTFGKNKIKMRQKKGLKREKEKKEKLE